MEIIFTEKNNKKGTLLAFQELPTVMFEVNLQWEVGKEC